MTILNHIMIMSKKKDIWSQITRTLQPKLTKSEFNVWFSHASLQRVDEDLVIIDVPNKFVAKWLEERYLPEIEKSFKRILKRTPAIRFNFETPAAATPVSSPFTSTYDQPSHNHHLMPFMTFERFITAQSNRFAWSSALEVAKRPGEQYNPLYIYGNSGVGKTHLLHAIGNFVLKKDPLAQVGFYSSESFTSEFTYSLNNGKTQDLRDRCCKLDLLLFDNIHILANRKRTQDEFLFIFNSLYSSKAQVVVTSDRPPPELAEIHAQLKSRLGWGLISEIQTPEQDLKFEIVKIKASEDGLDFPEDVLFYLANTSPDIKSLLRSIIKISTYASLHDNGMSISVVKSLVKEKKKAEITLDDIKRVTAGYFNISIADLVSANKKRMFSYPRQMAMYLARKNTKLSYKDIGNGFGSKDHSTVIYAIRRIQTQKDRKKPITDDLKKIEDMLG